MTLPTGSAVWGCRLNREPTPDDYFQYTLGDSIGNPGGAGRAFKIHPRTDPPLVGKVYNPQLINRIKTDNKFSQRIVIMALHRDELHTSLPFATWPRRLLVTSKNPQRLQDHLVGFSMEMLTGTVSLWELISQEQNRLRITRQDTLYIATTIADQVARMHRHPWGFVFGDISPRNIHVTLDLAKVRFIDTDSFQFDYNQGKYSFFLSGLTPGYSSPGSRTILTAQGRLTATHDDFVLATLIFMMLMADHQYFDTHPFRSGDHNEDDLIDSRQFPYDAPQSYPVPGPMLEAYQSFAPDIRAAFTRSFTQPTPVTAKEWTDILIKQRRLL